MLSSERNKVYQMNALMSSLFVKKNPFVRIWKISRSQYRRKMRARLREGCETDDFTVQGKNNRNSSKEVDRRRRMRYNTAITEERGKHHEEVRCYDVHGYVHAPHVHAFVRSFFDGLSDKRMTRS